MNWRIAMSARLRVFISSVIEGFRPYREAAAAGIEDAGGEAVMVERLPSLDQSSRNACLDGVQTSDASVVIVGSRGGWVTPSGRLAVEEEFEAAQRRALPILVFLQDVNRDPDSERLAKRLSDYISGWFRTTFTDAADLRSKVAAGVRRLGESVRIPLSDPQRVQDLLDADEPDRRAYEASVRLAIVPERRDELVAPERIASGDFAEEIYRVGHDTAVRLFDYRCAKSSQLSREGTLAIEQEPRDRDDARVAVRLTPFGEAVVQAELMSKSERSSLSSSMMILEPDLVSVLKREFAFAAGIYGHLDPHERFGQLWMGSAIVGAAHRYLFSVAPHGSGLPMRMGDDGPVVAEPPRKIGRPTLRAPENEIGRLIARFRILLGAPRGS